MLAVRNCRWYLRNPELMLAKLFTYIFMGAFMGAPLLMLLFMAGSSRICRKLCLGFCMMCEGGVSFNVSFLWCRTLNDLYPS